MAAPTRGNVFRNTGALYANPVNSNDLGTPLGAINLNSIRIDPGITAAFVRAEEYGNRATEMLLIHKETVLSWVQRGWDNDALPLIFPGITTGGSGDALVSIPGSTPDATRLSQTAIRLLFKNDHPERPSFLFHNLVILPELSQVMTFSLKSELKIGVTGIGLVGGGAAVSIGRFEDLTI